MRPTRFRLLVAVTVPVAVTVAAAAVTATAQAATAGCQVTYSVSSQWPGGFGATVTLTNLGDPVTGWTLAWAFGAGQQITQAWSATVTQSGFQVSARNAAWNGNLATNGTASFGFNGSWNGSNPAPTAFALNGVTCTGVVGPSTPPTTTPTTAPPTTTPTTAPPTTTPTTAPPTGRPHGPNSMGFIGCSMAENVAQGYVADGGKRMWGPYGTGGLVWNTWTDTNSSSWQKFDQQAARFGKPDTVWVQICTFSSPLPTYNDAKTLIANARRHAAPGAAIIISGMPQYTAGHVCFLAGATGTPLTDTLAKQAAADATQNVTYPGQFHLSNDEVLSDTCHANTAGQADLGRQALAFWG